MKLKDKVRDIISKVFASKIGNGISWNMVSVAFLAVSGLVTNILIGYFYGTEVLGYYGLAFAWYVAFSQLAVVGIHFSVLKYVSEFSEDDEKCSKIMTSALTIVVLTSLFVISILYIALNILVKRFDAMEIKALFYCLPALLFFSLNKVLLNYYNAKHEMKIYAIFQSLRNLLLMLSFIILMIFKVNGIYLTLCFVISEGILFICLGLYTLYKRKIRFLIDKYWYKENLRFGKKIMPSNIVLQLNFKVDILCLGLFLSDSMVGIYIFVAMFAEGFYQLIIVVRRNINPLITQYYTQKKLDLLENLRVKVRKYTRILVPIGALLLMIVYPLICLIMGKSDFLGATYLLLILLTSMSTNAYHTCFGNMLNQVGFPKDESLLNIFTILANIMLNLTLIPILGLYGAAIATALSYFIFSIILYFMVKKRAKFTLFV